MTRLAAALALLGACGDNVTFGPAEPAVVDLALPAERELDLLYVIDDSIAFVEAQIQLRLTFSNFLELIRIDGELPDLHIGIITADLGALMMFGDPNCENSDEGHLQIGSKWAPCTMIDGRFISDVADGAGGRTTNYTASLLDVFSCMTSLGGSGCGFEQHLESMRRALQDADGFNAGFLRPTAQLGIVIVADEDDCSARDPAFFGPESPEIGPLDSFRCFEFGVECDEPDPRAEGPRTNCRPREPGTLLYGVQEYFDFLHDLRPGRVTVAGIYGDPEPVEVGRRLPMGQTQPRPDLLPSCISGDRPQDISTADAGVRLDAFVRGFGDRSRSGTVCTEDYLPVVSEYGTALHDRLVGQPCLRKALWDANPLTDELDASCELLFTGIDQDPTPLAACDDAASNPPCWRLVADATCGAAPADLRIDAVGIEPVQGRHIQGRCQVTP